MNAYFWNKKIRICELHSYMYIKEALYTMMHSKIQK